MSNGPVLGKLEIESTASGNPVTITLDGDLPSIVIKRTDGSIAMELQDDVFLFHAPLGNPAGLNSSGSVWAGGSGKSGKLHVFAANGKSVLEVLAAESSIKLTDGEGHLRAEIEASTADLWLGGDGAAGDVLLLPKEAKEQKSDEAAIRLSAGSRMIRIGLNAAFGDQEEIRLDGKGRSIRISGPDPDDATGTAPSIQRAVLDASDAGLLQLRDERGVTMIELRAGTGAGRFGGRGVDGDLLVFSKKAEDQSPAQAAIWIRGDKGDIQLQNSDCAEEFDVADGQQVDPGTVVVLDDEGRLAASRDPYDKRVAGVVAGAGDLRPGIVLGRRSGAGRVPVTLMGRVCCKVDAAHDPVRVGDLLTTSSTEGHAMRVADPSAATGAVLGKALAPVERGTALIPMLLALG
jgi:hypothetical protein